MVPYKRDWRWNRLELASDRRWNRAGYCRFLRSKDGSANRWVEVYLSVAHHYNFLFMKKKGDREMGDSQANDDLLLKHLIHEVSEVERDYEVLRSIWITTKFLMLTCGRKNSHALRFNQQGQF